MVDKQKQLEKLYKLKLINYLLSLNQNSRIEKIKVITLAKDYFLQVLKNEYIVNTKEPMFIFEDRGASVAGGYTENNEIILYINTFGNYKYLMDDILTIAHELRHFAQFNCQRKDKDKLNGKLISSPHRLELCKALFFQQLYCNGVKEPIPNVDKIFRQHDLIWLKYHYLLEDGYYNKEFEMDARGFATNAIYDLLFDIDESKLSIEQLENLYSLRKSIEQSLLEEEETLLYLDANSSISEQGLKKDVSYFQQRMKNKIPKIIGLLKTQPEALIIINDAFHYDLVEAITQSLQIVYDDKLAHDLFNALLYAYSDNRDNKQLGKLLLDMYIYTDIKLNNLEEIYFSALVNITDVKQKRREYLESIKPQQQKEIEK